MSTHQVVCIHGITSRSSDLPYRPFAKALREQTPDIAFHFADWRELAADRLQVGSIVGNTPFDPPLEKLLQHHPPTFSERAALWLARYERDVTSEHPCWNPATVAYRAELKLIRWLLDYVSDIEFYLRDDEARSDIQHYIASVLQGAARQGPVTVVAHSLGTVIAFEVLHSLMATEAIELFVTFGSPLQLLLYAFHGMGLVTYELLLPPRIAWLNFYDIKDFVASELVTGDFAAARSSFFMKSPFGLRELGLTDRSGSAFVEFAQFWETCPTPVRANIAVNRYPSALLAHNGYWHHNANYVGIVRLVAEFLKRRS